jgi:hypothetical protein
MDVRPLIGGHRKAGNVAIMLGSIPEYSHQNFWIDIGWYYTSSLYE